MSKRGHLTLGQPSELNSIQLAEYWSRLYGTPAPAISPELLRLGLAYKLQTHRNGGLLRTTKTLLKRASSTTDSPDLPKLRPRKLTPGTRLVRDWHGIGHNVTVLEDGFEYDGKRWLSLSAIAQAITGAHWNGPRFFGLAERRK